MVIDLPFYLLFFLAAFENAGNKLEDGRWGVNIKIICRESGRTDGGKFDAIGSVCQSDIAGISAESHLNIEKGIGLANPFST